MAIEYFPYKPDFWPPALYNGVEMTGSRKLNTGTSGYQVTFNNDYLHLGKGDHGGPWLMEKTVYTYVFGHFNNKNPSLGYNGPTLPWDDNTFYLPSIGSVPTDASYYTLGASAIAATEPSKSVFNGSVFLGETLQDGLPLMAGQQVWRDKTLRAKQAGGEYLNYQFGWLPLVSDMRNFGYAVGNSARIVADYKSHAGVKIRRRLLLSDTLDQQTETALKPIRTFGSKSIGSVSTSYSSSLRERKWFAGAYQYAMPMDNSMASRFKRYRAYARKLYGLELTPEVLWNIAPWSWAVDWKLDVGSVLHNWSALGHNGLVLQYGYIMHEQTATWTASSQYGLKSVSVIRKRRVAANPYGFGVLSGSLSDTQIAVLASLGLTRGDSRIAR